jgi:hypothetical protein
VIEELLHLASNPAAERDLRKLVAEHVRALEDSRRVNDGGLVERVERSIRADPASAFAFDPKGLATLSADGRSWCAGRFETPSIGELQTRTSANGGAARLWVFDGVSPATDIGALQATGGGRCLFQVASQFNCLESPGPRIVPVASYFSDWTQGPRASISAFPATLQRHYAAPAHDGSRFVQHTGGRQIDLLADAFAPEPSPVRNGYLTGDGGLGAHKVATALEERFDHIRVGIHDEAAVVLGYNWYGTVANADQHQITQCFTSTVAGSYGGERALGASFEPACRQLLRAAYLGTLLAAIDLNRSPVVLTLIGGGAFGNPLTLIWESIICAFDQAQPHAAGMLDVIVNARNVGHGIQPETVLADVRRRDGAVLRFDNDGLSQIDR